MSKSINALGFLAITWLAACSSPPLPSAVAVIPTAPEALMACKDRPAPAAVEMDSDAAMYITRLYAAWDDCHGKLGALAGWLRSIQPTGAGK
jgi:hypothetical protein